MMVQWNKKRSHDLSRNLLETETGEIGKDEMGQVLGCMKLASLWGRIKWQNIHRRHSEHQVLSSTEKEMGFVLPPVSFQGHQLQISSPFLDLLHLLCFVHGEQEEKENDWWWCFVIIVSRWTGTACVTELGESLKVLPGRLCFDPPPSFPKGWNPVPLQKNFTKNNNNLTRIATHLLCVGRSHK